MKIYLDIVGCRLNQAEIERYAHQFRSIGYELVSRPDDADLAVINTCSVTAAAASDSRQKVRQVWKSGRPEINLTGCWATLNPDDAAALPGVTRVVTNEVKDELVALLTGNAGFRFELEPVEREPVPGNRLRTRSFIKVQDGCDNQCTFCITTIARGAGRSRPAAEIITDIQTVSSQNSNFPAREVVLTGVHMGSWGSDFSPALKFSDLVGMILESTDVPRIRLSSIEPWHLDENFFRLWENPRLCRQLHLPLQSGSATVLRRMRRNVTPAGYARLVKIARDYQPEMAITTDIIAGFPGESEAEFSESLEFIREMNFAGGHVFTYSAREGTPAARMAGQVPHPICKDRNAHIRSALKKSSAAYRQRFIGRILPVLWESAGELGTHGWKLNGMTDNYVRVAALASQNLWNQITPVRIKGENSHGVVGEIFADSVSDPVGVNQLLNPDR